jgi:hypothetical protein
VRSLAERAAPKIGVIVRVLLAVLVVVAVANVWQILRERDARIDQNRALIERDRALTCAIGAFLVDARRFTEMDGRLTPEREAAYARILAAVSDDDCPPRS